jgi:hypothetical protein
MTEKRSKGKIDRDAGLRPSTAVAALLGAMI